MKAISLMLCIGFVLSLSILTMGEVMNSIELLEKADSTFQARDYEGAMPVYLEAYEQAIKEHNNSVIVESGSQVARCHLKNNDHEQCQEWLDKASDVASPEDPAGWSRYLGVRGRLEWQIAAKEAKDVTPVVDKAKETFVEMYDYCIQHNLHERAIDAAHMVAIVGTPEERIEWGEKGIEAAEKGGIEGWLPALWNNHGWNLSDAGRHEEALEALKQAKTWHYKFSDERSKLIADYSVGFAYRMTGNLSAAKEVMTKVSQDINKRYMDDPNETNAEWVGFSAKELGEIALAEGKRDNVLEYFTLAKKNLEKAGQPEWDKKGFDELLVKIEELESGN